MQLPVLGLTCLQNHSNRKTLRKKWAEKIVEERSRGGNPQVLSIHMISAVLLCLGDSLRGCCDAADRQSQLGAWKGDKRAFTRAGCLRSTQVSFAPRQGPSEANNVS